MKVAEGEWRPRRGLRGASSFVLAIFAALVWPSTVPGLLAQTGQGPSDAGTLRGRVLETGSDTPVPGAIVNLVCYLDARGELKPPLLTFDEAFFAPTLTRHVLTGAQGFFSFSNLPDGRCAISADAFGYEVPRYETRLVQIDGSVHDSITLRVWRYGSIAGRVVDEIGEPVVGVPVAVLRHIRGGRSPALRTLREAVLTDDRGVYRIPELPPGRYVVGALSTTTSMPVGVADDLHDAAEGPLGGSLWQGLRDSAANEIRSGEGIRFGAAVVQGLGSHVIDPDSALLTYPTTFYPGVVDGLNAAVLDVASGEARAGIDIPVRYSRNVQVSGFVIGPDGPVPSIAVRLLPPDADGGVAWALPSITAVTAENGAFTFVGVFPGQYLLSVIKLQRSPGADVTDTSLWAQRSVTVGDTDVDDLNVVLSSGFHVRGRVVFPGGSDQHVPEDRQVVVRLRPFGTATSSRIGLSATVRSDGTFTTDAVPPGRYQIRFSISCRQPAVPCPSTWHWQHTYLNGEVQPYDVLDVRTTDVSGVEATFSEASIHLSGAVADASGSRRPDTHIIVFPADTTLWREDLFDRRVRRVHANTDATFDIPGLPPGEYYLAAVMAPYPNSDPRDLEPLIPLAVTIALREGEHKTVRLQVVTPTKRLP